MASSLSDGRKRAWDLLGVAGVATPVRFEFPVNSDVSAGVSVWLGGASADGDDFTGATEVPLTSVANVAEGQVPGQTAQTRLRVTLGGSLLLVGQHYVVAEGSHAAPSSTSLTVPDGTTVVIEVGSLPGAALSVDDDGYLVAVVPSGALSLDDDGFVVLTT